MNNIIKSINLIGALLIGVGIVKDGCKGKEIYRGNINGREVRYFENALTLKRLPDFHFNEMRIKNGKTTYILRDITDEKSVKSPKYQNQTLEEVIISGRRIYCREDSKGNDLDSQHIKNTLEKCDKSYNDLREKIRTEIKADYNKSEENIFKGD